MTPEELSAMDLDDLRGDITAGIYGDDRMTRKALGAALDALAELVRRAEEAATLRTERDRLARVLAVERGDESQAPAGWKRAAESDCEWELTPYDEEDGPEWGIERVIWSDGLPRWTRVGPHAREPQREKIRTALEAMEAADLARGVRRG